MHLSTSEHQQELVVIKTTDRGVFKSVPLSTLAKEWRIIEILLCLNHSDLDIQAAPS